MPLADDLSDEVVGMELVQELVVFQTEQVVAQVSELGFAPSFQTLGSALVERTLAALTHIVELVGP